MKELIKTLFFAGNYHYLPTTIVFWYSFLFIIIQGILKMRALVSELLFLPLGFYLLMFSKIVGNSFLGVWLNKIGLMKVSDGWVSLGGKYDLTNLGVVVFLLLTVIAILVLNFFILKLIRS